MWLSNCRSVARGRRSPSIHVATRRLEVEVEPEAEDAEERLRDAVDEVAPALVHAAIVCEDRSMKQSKLDPVQTGDVEGALSG